MRAQFFFASALTFAAVFQSLHADFVVPAFRGSPQTTYQHWNVFTSLTGPNVPDVANVNSNGMADLIETGGLAFVTGGGNIYSFAGVTSFEVTVPDSGLGAGYVTDVVFQVRTQGTPISLTSVLFNGIAPDSSELLFESTLGGFGGLLQDWKFEWQDLPGSLASNLLTFSSSESSMSLDVVAIDTQTSVVPEVGTMALGLISTGGFSAVVIARRVRRTRGAS